MRYIPLKTSNKTLKKLAQKITLCTSVLLVSSSVFASIGAKLENANTDINNLKSLQNGAKIYFNTCSGCHAIEFMRYQRIADDLQIDAKLVKENFIFTSQKLGQTVKSAMPKAFGVQAFGASPPDLSLTARSRGIDWIYSYLKGFYPDASRPFGVNNHILGGASMPDVLVNHRLELSPAKFDSEVRDITNFLDYVSEPIQLKRPGMGVSVLIFLALLLIFSYLLKKEYWRDVKYGQWRAKN